MKNITALFILIILTISACEPAPKDLFTRTFLIRKGEHYSTPRLVETLQSSRLSFKATFDESAVYDHGTVALQDAKNKLLGFSDCNSLHHQNSARFAWQWFDNRLEIYAYCYVNGERAEAFIGTVNLGEENRYEIVILSDEYKFTLNNNESVLIPRGNNCDKGVYYMLWPYFGGAVPAPHDVTIKIHRAP